MILYNKRITKALIRLRGCAGWSAPSLFANLRRQVFSRRGPIFYYWLVQRVSQTFVFVKKLTCVLLTQDNHWQWISATALFFQASLQCIEGQLKKIHLDKTTVWHYKDCSNYIDQLKNIAGCQSELPRPIPRNSVESDHGCTSRIYFDNDGDNVTLTLYNVTLTSQKPC